MNKRIASLILAAGSGKRFGMPKWEATYKGKTFLEHIYEKLNLAGIKDIICVKRKEFQINNILLKYVINPTPELGMFSSIYYALKEYKNFDGYLIWPVDHPFVLVSTINFLVSSFNKNSSSVCRPVYLQQVGHPVILPYIVTNMINTPDFSGGLRDFIKQSKIKTFDIAVNDPYILKNINNAEDIFRRR